MDALLRGLAEAVKLYLLPGSLPLLLLAVTAGLLWWSWRPGSSRRVRAGLGALVAGYWLLATPVVADGLQAALASGYTRLEHPVEAQAVVVLGGGADVLRAEAGSLSIMSDASALRALEAARVVQLVEPTWVIVSGGPGRDPRQADSVPLKSALVELGVPEDLLLLDTSSRDTHDQALRLEPLLAELGVERFVLVTSPSHMRRSMLAFQGAGLAPIASVAPAESQDPSRAEPPRWLPSMNALQRSTDVFRELLGLVYYWVRGWL